MTKSPEIKNLATALALFRGKMVPVVKDAVNPHYKSAYASLDAILETIKIPLDEAGLSFAQFPDDIGLTTILMHKSGEWIEASFAVPLSKSDPQGFGSALTYMRRYALGAILGLSTEEDDDGEGASKTAAKVAGPVGEPFTGKDDFKL